MGARRYFDLIAWQKARLLNKQVYLASRSWPTEERFGLTSQIRSAAVSVMANIAEGSGRGSDADFLRFLRIANGSVMEIESHLYAALDLQFIPAESHAGLLAQAQEVGRILNGLMDSLERKDSR